MGLDPSFGVEYLDLKAGDNFEKTFTGFAPFNIPVQLFFTRDTGIPIEERKPTFDHYLVFEGKGGWRTFNVNMNKKKLKNIKRY